MRKFRLPADDLEYTVLVKLWELREASVRTLHEGSGEADGLVYTTTAKVVDRLREKGLVARQRSGTSFVYRPRAAREDVERARAQSAVGRLLGTAPHAAVAALVEAVDLVEPGLLDELQRQVAARRKLKRGT